MTRNKLGRARRMHRGRGKKKTKPQLRTDRGAGAVVRIEAVRQREEGTPG